MLSSRREIPGQPRERTVNAICPGIIGSDMWAYNDEHWGKLLGNYQPGELMKEWIEGVPLTPIDNLGNAILQAIIPS